MLFRRTSRGFTVVELLIVLVVIGIIAGIVAVSYGRAQALARDTKRVADVNAIAEAITAYRLRVGNQVRPPTCMGGHTPTGAVADSTGNGWFNLANGSTYHKDILTCLTEKGYLNSKYVDPSGCGTTLGNSAPGYTCRQAGYAYMKSTCDYDGDGQWVTVVMARLELSGNKADLQGSNSVCMSNSYANSFEMNYMVKVE